MTDVVIALLRGVNLGGRTVRSTDLREVATGLGYREVVTHLASGNLVAVADAPAPVVATQLSAALHARVGFAVPVVTRDLAGWDAAVAALPWPQHAAAAPARLALACFAEPVADTTGFDATRYGPDEVVFGPMDAYLWYPDGQASTKLTIDVLSRAAGSLGTARNWNTVLALSRLAHDRSGSDPDDNDPSSTGPRVAAG